MQPILASTLYDLVISRRHAFVPSVRTGLTSIDEILGGGIRNGQISCISGDRGTGKTLIALHLLVSHLLSNSVAQAAIIDTSGSFDVLRLYQAIVSRLRRASSGGNASKDDKDHDAVAAAALDRVKIMRVFDFIGVIEAVNELRNDIDKVQKEAQSTNRTVAPVITSAKKSTKPVHAKGRTHIADSQAEASDEDEDDDLMLLVGAKDGNNESRSTELPPQPPTLDPVSFILIDNLTTAINPILKTSYPRALALLSTFLRSLSHLTRSSNLYTLLLTTAASPRNTVSHTIFPGLVGLQRDAESGLPASTYVPESTPQPTAASHNTHSRTARIDPWRNDEEDPPSAFSSTTVKPSLGRALESWCGLVCLLSFLPRSKVDSQILLGDRVGKARTVRVLEVLRNRGRDGAGGEGLGRWAGFEIVDGVELRSPL